MSLPTEEFPVLQQLGTIQQISSPISTRKDSLINQGWQREQYIGIAVLLASLIVLVGFFSRRFEYALLFAFALSVILIIFFLTV